MTQTESGNHPKTVYLQFKKREVPPVTCTLRRLTEQVNHQKAYVKFFKLAREKFYSNISESTPGNSKNNFLL